MFTLTKPEDWPTVRATLPPATFWVDQIVPAGGKTLLHGPPGCGKSALLWSMGNAIVEGADWMGLRVSKGKPLLLSNDMTLHQFAIRWGESFWPQFPFVAHQKMDITKPGFCEGKEYAALRFLLDSNDIDLVMIDAIGGLHAGKSNRDDSVATLVDAALSSWFGGRATVMVAHDRKVRVDPDGNPAAPTAEDFLGSQLWRANATSQLHMWKAGAHLSLVSHEKSQVAGLLSDTLKVYIDVNGIAEPWDEHRAKEGLDKWSRALKHIDGLANLAKAEQVAKVAEFYRVSERTVWRWRKLAD